MEKNDNFHFDILGEEFITNMPKNLDIGARRDPFQELIDQFKKIRRQRGQSRKKIQSKPNWVVKK